MIRLRALRSDTPCLDTEFGWESSTFKSLEVDVVWVGHGMTKKLTLFVLLLSRFKPRAAPPVVRFWREVGFEE